VPAVRRPHIRGVKNGPARAGCRTADRVGLRPISALVDITNFMTLDVDRPLHVFDVAKLDRNHRRAPGAPGREASRPSTARPTRSTQRMRDRRRVARRSASAASWRRPNRAARAETTEVFIEAALFDPLRTAATGRKHQIQSDARYRFERGVDPEAVIEGMEAATKLVQELCGGEASELVVTGAVPKWQRSYPCGRRASSRSAGSRCRPIGAAILDKLGFTAEKNGDSYRVAPPSWRGDVQGEADLGRGGRAHRRLRRDRRRADAARERAAQAGAHRRCSAARATRAAPSPASAWSRR
jgi:phenylalanyl-tRNA synthetase beta chain